MKNENIQIRIAPELKKRFKAAAKLNYQTLSQFLVQAAITAERRAVIT